MNGRLLLAPLAVALAAALSGAAPAPGAAPEWVERESVVMGTRLRLRVAAPTREAGLEASEAALAEVRRLDRVLSSWRDDSEIGRLNTALPGEPMPLSPELWSLLEEAREWGARSDGAFDPAVGALVDAWDLRGEGREPDAAALAAALAASGPESFAWHPGKRAASRRSAGAWIDTGGFGKGAALRAAGRVLRERGVHAALLDFGGQILTLGTPPEGSWTLAVAHPSRRGEPAAWLRVEEASVATSSQSERFVTVGGERFGHVLDPRDGRPVSAWGSVTVVAADAMLADILSTALLVLGPDEAERLAETLPEVGVLILEEGQDGVRARWNPAFEQYRILSN